MVTLHESWKAPLQVEFEAPYMAALKDFLVAERDKGKRIFPKGSEWFHALDATPLEKVRVVILGQDPYHGEGQAHGLCFSVKPGVGPPPSFINIYKEIKSDLGLETPSHGNLEPGQSRACCCSMRCSRLRPGVRVDTRKGLGTLHRCGDPIGE